MTVKLSGLSGSFTATWFDTRTGVETSAGVKDTERMRQFVTAAGKAFGKLAS